MSGDCWIMGTYGGRYYPVETVDYLENVLAEGGYAEGDFRIYQGIGTDDPIWDQTDSPDSGDVHPQRLYAGESPLRHYRGRPARHRRL